MRVKPVDLVGIDPDPPEGPQPTTGEYTPVPVPDPDTFTWLQVAAQQVTEQWEAAGDGKPLTESPGLPKPKVEMTPGRDIGEILDEYVEAGGALEDVITPGEWRAYGAHQAYFLANADLDLAEALLPVSQALQNEPDLCAAIDSVFYPPGYMGSGITPEAISILFALSEDESGVLARMLHEQTPTIWEPIPVVPVQSSYGGHREVSQAEVRYSVPYGWEYVPLSQLGGTDGMRSYSEYSKDPYFINTNPESPNFGEMRYLSDLERRSFFGDENTIIIDTVPVSEPPVLFLSPDGIEDPIHPNDINCNNHDLI